MIKEELKTGYKVSMDHFAGLCVLRDSHQDPKPLTIKQPTLGEDRVFPCDI